MKRRDDDDDEAVGSSCLGYLCSLCVRVRGFGSFSPRR